ncbi:hypothetical protein BDZ94DRAFT_1248771 [Collybia nuda]|uniref:Uncharacterized protein n=1 Tax=Collybia nuda TaxID=64659 RepID=A0A9P5YF12_9AGAR|nr:hypothetical protein BDZ94DRAFT_1248771 [Collybia nuda]
MSNNQHLPETIVFGKGMTMTFLRNEPYLTKTHISGAPDADVLYVPPHWHETHNEIICVLDGQMEITLGASVRLYGPHDGDVVIPKGAIHSLKTYKGVACTFQERTDPMDGEKEVFFRNMLGQGAPQSNILALAQTCYYGDTRPAFPGHFIWLEKVFVTLLGGYLAPLLGYRLKHEFPNKQE